MADRRNNLAKPNTLVCGVPRSTWKEEIITEDVI